MRVLPPDALPRPNMPKYYEFVFASYGIWIGVFALYLLYVVRRTRSVRRALERLNPGTHR